MEQKLFDSELKVMEILWRSGPTTAKEIARELQQQVGWSKTTTYTVIKKCLEKGALSRTEPSFLCAAMISREEARARETAALIDKLYDGAADQLVASLLDSRRLSAAEIKRLKQLIEDLE